MKKLLCVMLALVAVPAMAVQFTLTDAGSGKLTVGYTVAAGEVVRGMALKVSVLSGDAKIASSSALNLGTCPFNVFMDYAYDVNETYAIGQGNAIAKADSVGPMSSFTTYAPFSVSMGYLDQDADQTLGEGITTSGSFDIQFALTGNSEVKVEADTLRGGAVVGDALVADNLPLTKILVVQVAETITGTPVVAKTTAAPAIASKVNASRLETFAASGVAGSAGGTLEYQFNFGGVAGPWGAATQTYTFATATTAAWTANVTVQARLQAAPTVLSVVSSPLAVTGEAVKSTATFYAAWAQFGRPNCWAFQRNCRGDADGVKQPADKTGTPPAHWVGSPDLGVLASAWQKADASLTGTMICADFDRVKQPADKTGTPPAHWVGSPDLGILAASWQKAEAVTTVCPQTNYNFWTN